MTNKEKEEYWHNFYSKAWGIRKKIAQDIIDSGETNPLRVLKIFNSIIRFSGEMKMQSDGNMAFDQDSIYPQDDISNITIDENSISFKQVDKLPFGQDTAKVRTFRDNLYVSSLYSEFNKENFLLDYIRNKNFDAIIELGSGYCNNLVNLYGIGGPKVPYYGGEYTKEGTEFAQMIADLDDDMNLTPFRFDYTNPNLSIVSGKYKNPFVFTCHSIEQVEYIPSNLFEKISKIAQNVTCMHIEPFGYQMVNNGKPSKTDAAQKEVFENNHWNKNLYEELMKNAIYKKIDLIYIQKNIISDNDAGNPASLALWKSIN